jgi:class 3 adenylate cyclase
VIAAVCELMLRFEDDAFDIHAGIAGGHVLLFEGDDYIGPAANHASRLCEAAAPGETLAVGVGAHLPDWVHVAEDRPVHAPGVGDLPSVLRLVAAPDVIGQRRAFA